MLAATELRLKSYKTFYNDGRSSTTFDIADKSKVFVALIVGSEPACITDVSQYLDVDQVILDMAEAIQKARALRKAKLKKPKPKPKLKPRRKA